MLFGFASRLIQKHILTKIVHYLLHQQAAPENSAICLSFGSLFHTRFHFFSIDNLLFIFVGMIIQELLFTNEQWECIVEL